jgi:hypothetical protein
VMSMDAMTPAALPCIAAGRVQVEKDLLVAETESALLAFTDIRKPPPMCSKPHI